MALPFTTLELAAKVWLMLMSCLTETGTATAQRVRKSAVQFLYVEQARSGEQ
jgi:hypothetical protein